MRHQAVLKSRPLVPALFLWSAHPSPNSSRHYTLVFLSRLAFRGSTFQAQPFSVLFLNLPCPLPVLSTIPLIRPFFPRFRPLPVQSGSLLFLDQAIAAVVHDIRVDSRQRYLQKVAIQPARLKYLSLHSPTSLRWETHNTYYASALGTSNASI